MRESIMRDVPKIKCGPVVEVLGDEMARVIWDEVRNKLILPHLDVELLVYDLGLRSRNKSNDKITIYCARAIIKYQVGVKCATITPHTGHIKLFGLKKVWKSPNTTIRRLVKGTVFREPIMCENVPKSIPEWTKPIIIGRHAFGDQYECVDFNVTAPGKVSLLIKPDAAHLDHQEILIHEFTEPGVAMGMFNVDASIKEFAHSCFKFALNRKYPLYLTTKCTILKKYDTRFKDLFQEIYDNFYMEEFQKNSLKYQHKIINEMLKMIMKSEGGFVWASKNYDGDVESDFLAQGYGSLGIMTSMLSSPDGKIVETESVHGTIPKHYALYLNGKETSTNPTATIFAWARGLAHRASLDNNKKLKSFAKALEDVCIETIESGCVTKDLALCIKGPNITKSDYMETFEYIEILSENLKIKLGRT